MFFHFKHLIKQILIYGLGDTINKLIGVLTIPLFTRFLTPADYGVAGVLVVTNTLIIGFCDLGMSNAMARFSCDEKNPRKVFSSAQLAMVTVTVLVSAAGIILAQPFSQFIFKSPNYSQEVIFSFLTLPFTLAVTAPLMKWRLEHQAKKYAFFNVFRVVSLLVINVILVVIFKMGLKGYILGPLLNAAFYAFVLWILTSREIGFDFDRELFKKMIRFGFPFVLGLMAFWVIDWADRFILAKITNTSEVGLYTLGYTIGMAVMLFVGSFQTAWTPFYISVYKKRNAKKIYTHALTYYSLGMGFIVLFVAVFSRDYFYFFTPAQFHSAYLVVPLISLAYALRGNYSIIGVGGFLKKRPIFELTADMAALAVNIGGMFLLIPIFGRLGAAWATLVSYAVLSIALFSLTYKIYPIRYEYQRIIKILFVGMGLYLMAKLVYEPSLSNLLIRLVIVMMYPLTFLVIGFFNQSELKHLEVFQKKVWQRIIRR